jgi:hypothetical protein
MAGIEYRRRSQASGKPPPDRLNWLKSRLPVAARWQLCHKQNVK